MTKGQALYNFFSGFGLTAYVENNVPESADFPYLTYQAAFDSLGSPVALTVNLWYRTGSEAEPNAKAQEIAKAIGRGVYTPCDDGAVLLMMGSPAWQAVNDPTDTTIKRRYLNVTAEYLTLY